MTADKYDASKIKVLEGLEGVRRKFDVVELSRKIKKKGDILILSEELKVKPRTLQLAFDEGRILRLIPDIQKSKASILARLRTDREVKLFAQKYDLEKSSPKKLLSLVRQWKQDIQKNPFLLLNQEEHDLILGSLMGDASVRKRELNSCFRVAHSIKQEEYIKWKLELLKHFNISEFEQRKRIINKREVNMIYLSTKTHSVFNYYRNLFYTNDRKKITLEILNQLNSRSLAVWICDDGSYDNKQGYIVLCTNSFSLEEHKLMKEFFNEKFGLDPTIGFR
ncbi:MAG: hypothetical protein ISS82_05395, partial [Nanoarchaeota archaeon]|nr:hypothetical protein [Nanoarchaeota archaeon]